MLSPTSLSTKSVSLLQVRGLSNQQVDDYAALLDKARAQLDDTASAKQVLSGLSADEMKLLQKATSLAQTISVGSLSNEGAMNLLAQPDKTDMVDLNNDGIVEVGVARMMTFPPVNAPASVKAAWDKATANLSESDKMQLEFHMITANGIELGSNRPKASTQSPEEQWSTAGWQQLLDKMRSALDFSVSMDGWTRTNMLRQDFYNKFEKELADMPPQQVAASTQGGK